MKRILRALPGIIGDLAGIAGGSLIALGAYDIYHPAGEITAGVMLVAGALLLARARMQPAAPPE